MPMRPPWAWLETAWGVRHVVLGGGAGGRLRPRPAVLRDAADARVQRLFAESPAAVVQALRVRVFGHYEMPAGYAVLVIESGAGEMRCEGDRCQVHKGETWVVPFGAGPLTITGDLRLLVCLPPEV